MSVETEARGAREVDRAVAHYVIRIAGPDPHCALCDRGVSPYQAVVYRGEVFCRDCIGIKLGEPLCGSSAAAGSSQPSRGAADSRSAASELPAEKAA